VKFLKNRAEGIFERQGIISIHQAIKKRLLKFTPSVEIVEYVSADKNEARYGQMINNQFMGVGRFKTADLMIEGQLSGD